MGTELLATLGSATSNAVSLLSLPRHAFQLAYGAYTGKASADDASERLGLSQHPRPRGPVLWFHAFSHGETAVALPLIFRCLLEYNEHVHVLLTTGVQETRLLLSSSLPARVIVQYVPLDNHVCMHLFLAHWRPQACILMESPAWPALVETCAAAKVRLALLNARMSSKSFLSWFTSTSKRAHLGRMLEDFTLIVPQSDVDVGRFRILGATLTQMPGWCSDLKYAAALGTSVWHLWRPKPSRITALRRATAGRPVWVAAHTAPGEEAAVGAVHVKLAAEWPGLLTVIMPRSSGRYAEVVQVLEEGSLLSVIRWSQVVDSVAPAAASTSSSQIACKRPCSSEPHGIRSNGAGSLAAAQSAAEGREQARADAAVQLLKNVDVIVLDVPSDLTLMYSVSEIAFVGNSLLEGCGGHNLAEAAVAGCAVVVGEYAGHFSTMADELNQAAVMAAEEAAAAVNSSGPLEEPFMYAAVLPNSNGLGEQSAAAAGGATESEAVVAGDEPSPRDGTHWSGAIEQQPSLGTTAAGLYAHHQQHPARPSTAPAAYHSGDGARAVVGAGRAVTAAAADVIAVNSNSTASEGVGYTSSFVPTSATGPSRIEADSSPAAGAQRADAVDDVGALGVLSEGQSQPDELLLQDSSLLSLPSSSGHVYDSSGVGAPPPSAASSGLFGGPFTGEDTPTSSTSGGGAVPEQRRQQQQGGSYAQAYAQRLYSRTQGDQQQQAGQAEHTSSSRLQVCQQQQHTSGDGQRCLHMPESPHCPATPSTPYPTPEDSAITFGGRSPISPYGGDATDEHQQQQQLVRSRLIDRAQLLSQQLTNSSSMTWGGDSGRSTADGGPVAAASTPVAYAGSQHSSPSQNQPATPLGQTSQEQQQQQSLPEAASGGGFFMSINGIASSADDQDDSKQARQQLDDSDSSRVLLRPLNPIPPDRYSQDGSVNASPVAANNSSSSSSVAASAARSRSQGGTGSSHMRWGSNGGSGWRAASSAGEALNDAAVLEGVIHEAPAVVVLAPAAAPAAPSDPDVADVVGVRAMGRSPTICELVTVDDRCGASTVESIAAADGMTAARTGSPSHGGAQPVDLYPALAAAAAAAGDCAAAAEVVVGCNGLIAKQGSIGWEEWDEQQQQRQQQQCTSHLSPLNSSGDADDNCDCHSTCSTDHTAAANSKQEAAELSSSGPSSAAASTSSTSTHVTEPDNCSTTAAATYTRSTPFAAGAAAAAAAAAGLVSSADSTNGVVGDGSHSRDNLAAGSVGNGISGGSNRTSSTGAGVTSRLGDPSRTTHYMDLQHQQQQEQVVAPLPQMRPVAVAAQCLQSSDSDSREQRVTGTTNTSSSNSQQQQHLYGSSGSGSGGQTGASSSSNYNLAQHMLQQQYGASTTGRASMAGTPGTSSSVSWYNATGGGTGGYFQMEGSSASLLDTDGRATPSSMYSPTSTATDYTATPMWQQQHSRYQQHSRVGHNSSSSDGQQAAGSSSAAAFAARGYRGRGSRPSGMSSTGDRPSGDGMWGRFGGLSGAATPGGLSCSETPLCADLSRAGTPAAVVAADPFVVPGTSYMRYRGEYILPATHLPYSPHGPAVWRVSGSEGLSVAVATLLREPLERRSRGHAATQAAAKLASGLVSTVWHVVDDMVVAPALQDYVAQHGAPDQSAVAAARAPTRVLGHSAPRS